MRIPQTLSSRSTQTATPCSLGRASPSGVDEFIVRTRARSAAGELSRIQNVATVPIIGNEFWDPAVAIDADGDAVFAWLGRDGTNWRVQTRARSASGALSPSQYVSVAGQDASRTHRRGWA